MNIIDRQIEMYEKTVNNLPEYIIHVHIKFYCMLYIIYGDAEYETSQQKIQNLPNNKKQLYPNQYRSRQVVLFFLHSDNHDHSLNVIFQHYFSFHQYKVIIYAKPQRSAMHQVYFADCILNYMHNLSKHNAPRYIFVAIKTHNRKMFVSTILSFIRFINRKDQEPHNSIFDLTKRNA